MAKVKWVLLLWNLNSFKKMPNFGDGDKNWAKCPIFIPVPKIWHFKKRQPIMVASLGFNPCFRSSVSAQQTRADRLQYLLALRNAIQELFQGTVR